jgi:hypothetical protein
MRPNLPNLPNLWVFKLNKKLKYSQPLDRMPRAGPTRGLLQRVRGSVSGARKRLREGIGHEAEVQPTGTRERGAVSIAHLGWRGGQATALGGGFGLAKHEAEGYPTDTRERGAVSNSPSAREGWRDGEKTNFFIGFS